MTKWSLNSCMVRLQPLQAAYATTSRWPWSLACWLAWRSRQLQTNVKFVSRNPCQTTRRLAVNAHPHWRFSRCKWDTIPSFWHACHVFDHTTPTAIVHLCLNWENLWEHMGAHPNWLHLVWTCVKHVRKHSIEYHFEHERYHRFGHGKVSTEAVDCVAQETKEMHDSGGT